MTLADWVTEATRGLVLAGRDERESGQDVAALARGRLGWSMAQWLTRLADPLPDGLAADLAPLLARRAHGEPVAYLTGEREFYGRPFFVTRDVLIPRPETELVVDAALRRLPQSGAAGTTPVIIDVGTGSGCVAVTLALEHQLARLVATDISAAALAVARRNAERLGVSDRIEFRQGALLAGWASPVDLIVSNPPYVATKDRNQLAPDVLNFEPMTALFAGEDGLLVIRDLLAAAPAVLGPEGGLIVEMGVGQADEVARLVGKTAGLRLVRIDADLQQIPRVMVAERAPRSL